MDFFISAFHAILYRPLFNILVLFYLYLPGHDLGIAIIALTLLIKFILFPLGIKSIRSQKTLSQIQPKIKEIQGKYKGDKQKQTQEIMLLYKKEKINPFSGCLPILIQLPILIALFRVFRGGLGAEQMAFLYNFVPSPEMVNPVFLGFIDLSRPNLYFALLAGILQFLQTRMTLPKTSKKKEGPGFSSAMQKQMQYFFPIFTVLILFRLPAAIGLYWLTITLFTIIQQYVMFRKPKQAYDSIKGNQKDN